MNADSINYIKLRTEVATWVAPDQTKREWLKLLTAMEKSEPCWAESHARLEAAVQERKRTLRLNVYQLVLLAVFTGLNAWIAA